MTTLRMTRPDTDCRRPVLAPGRLRSLRVAAFVACVALAGLSGCGSNPAPADGSAAGARLPPPATDQLEYDKTSGTLTLYQLPDSARWMIQLPGSPAPAPAAVKHRIPPGADPDRTLVFYARPGGHFSAPVSLRQIEKAQSKGHTS